MFEHVRCERSLILLRSLTAPDIIKQRRFVDQEIIILRNLAVEKLHRQIFLKKYEASQLLD